MSLQVTQWLAERQELNMRQTHDPPIEPTVFVVSGFSYSGTTMMMKALEAGGMKLGYDTTDPGLCDARELSNRQANVPSFPENYIGHLIKVQAVGLERMHAMPRIKVVFMRRDVEEIVEAYRSWTGLENITAEQVQQAIERGLLQARNRKDLSLIEVSMHAVMDSPANELEAIGRFFGVALDLEAAAVAVHIPAFRNRSGS